MAVYSISRGYLLYPGVLDSNVKIFLGSLSGLQQDAEAIIEEGERNEISSHQV